MNMIHSLTEFKATLNIVVGGNETQYHKGHVLCFRVPAHVRAILGNYVTGEGSLDGGISIRAAEAGRKLCTSSNREDASSFVYIPEIELGEIAHPTHGLTVLFKRRGDAYVCDAISPSRWVRRAPAKKSPKAKDSVELTPEIVVANFVKAFKALGEVGVTVKYDNETLDPEKLRMVRKVEQEIGSLT